MSKKQSHSRRAWGDDDYDITYPKSRRSKSYGGGSCGSYLGGHLVHDKEDTEHTFAEIKQYKLEKTKLMARACEEFLETGISLIPAYKRIVEIIKEVNAQLKDAWRNKDNGRTREERYQNVFKELSTKKGVHEASSIFGEIQGFITHHNLEVSHVLRPPQFATDTETHPKRVSIWYYHAKRTLLEASYLQLSRDEHDESRFVHTMRRAMNMLQGIKTWYEAHPKPVGEKHHESTAPAEGGKKKRRFFRAKNTTKK